MQRREDVCFGPFRLDLERERLWQGAKAIDLRPKSFAVLRYLLEHASRLITKDDLLQAVWPGIVVSESVLMVCLSELRRALGDDPRAPQFLETVPRRGYRFIGTISRPAPWIGAAALEPRPLPVVPPVVGRQVELAQLGGWWEEARRGERRLVFVTGEAGIGKTTVVDAFVTQAAAQGEVWSGRGQCIEHHGAGEAYLPVLDALARLCREPGGERLMVILHQYAPTWLVQMPWLLSGTDLETLQRRILGTTRERMLRELAEAVEALSRERPLLLVLEDLHWSDTATVDLLAWLPRRREPARLLLIGTYRPVDVILAGHPLRAIKQELARQRCCVELAVELLTVAEVAEYLAARCLVKVPEVTQFGDLATVIHQRTDGHPLFMVTLVDYLVQRGWLAAVDGQWQVQTAIAAVERGLPDSLRQLIEHQIEGLKHDDQRVLEAASIAGEEFSAAAAAAGLEIATVEVEERCEALARRGQFLQTAGEEAWPDGTVAGRYRFAHALYQQVLYNRLPAGRRLELHRCIGAREEAGYRERAGERAAALVMHFERGRDYPRALQYSQQAAENALRRHAYQEGIAHLTQGLELLQLLPETTERHRQQLDLQTALGPALIATKGYAAPEVEHTYARARALCQQLGDTPQLFQVLWGLWTFYLARGAFQTARELAEQLLTLAQRASDSTRLLQAHRALTSSLFWLGEFSLAQAHLEQGIALYDRLQQRADFALYGQDPGVVCLAYAAKIQCVLGYPDRSLQSSHEALTLAQELGQPYSLAVALYFAAWLRYYRREAQALQEQIKTLLALSHEQGFAFYVARGTILLGWALLQQGQQGEGIAQIRQGLATYRATGAELEQPHWLALLAEASAEVGQVEAGASMLTAALSAVQRCGGYWWEAELHRLRGELRLRQATIKGGSRTTGSEPEAETCFRQALEVAQRQRAKSLELRSALSLSRLWQRQGRRDEARELLAPIYGWFTDGFDTAELREARALLEELSSPPTPAA